MCQEQDCGTIQENPQHIFRLPLVNVIDNLITSILRLMCIHVGITEMYEIFNSYQLKLNI